MKGVTSVNGIAGTDGSCHEKGSELRVNYQIQFKHDSPIHKQFPLFIGPRVSRARATNVCRTFKRLTRCCCSAADASDIHL